MHVIDIIGGGLAGSEAAWQAANALQKAALTPDEAVVNLYEMRPGRSTEAHETEHLAELVCSNSFRSDDAENNAVGVLHEEMRRAGSLIMKCADAHQVPAGGALAVDRTAFAQAVTQAITDNPFINLIREEITTLPQLTPEGAGAPEGRIALKNGGDPKAGDTLTGARNPEDGWRNVIIATGPLTGARLAASLHQATGEEALAFFDAIAPIIYKDSINFNIAWFQSRYDKKGPGGDGADYINLPLSAPQYKQFIDALLTAEKTRFREWEKNTPYFEGCLPVEVMAERGYETLRFGPMKPVGLIDPRTNAQPYAVIQLRQDNALGTLYNMVGFQTKLTYGAQQSVLRTIPGLEDARFARMGGIHRNMFINAPRLLDRELRFRAQPHIRFAGQITGVEGYLESAACGLMAGRFAAAQTLGLQAETPPLTTALGALHRHITGGHLADGAGARGSYQPMNINFGLFEPIDTPRTGHDGGKLRGKQKSVARKQALCTRALSDIESWAKWLL